MAVKDKLISNECLKAVNDSMQDQVSDLKSAEKQGLRQITISEWERKGISSTDGSTGDANVRRLSTPQYIPHDIVYLEPSADAKLAIYVYDTDNTYLGIWNGSSLIKGANWVTSGIFIASMQIYNLRLLLMDKDDTSIQTSYADDNLTILATINDVAMQSRRLLTNIDDLDNILQMGVYNCSSNSLPAHYPVSAGGVIIVSATNGAVSQAYVTATEQYCRFKGANGWQNWITISNDAKVMRDRDVLDNTDDLNDVNQIGVYRCDTTSMPDHAPTDVGGVIVVFRYTTSYVQVFYNTFGSYYRYHSSTGTWGDWISQSQSQELSDRVDTLYNTIYPQDISKSQFTWESGGIDKDTGANTSSNYTYRSDEFIDADLLPQSFAFSGPKTYTKSGQNIKPILYIYEYAYNQSAGYLARRVEIGPHSGDKMYYRAPDVNYYRFVCGWASTYGVTCELADINKIFAISAPSTDPVFDSLIPRMSWRMANMLARARQMTALCYTPVGTIPNQSADMVEGTTYHGVPYSSVRALDTYIGIDVSLHTFFTAVQNPNSVLYTRKSTASNSRTYYGTTCSALASYCMGLPFPYNTDYMRASADYVKHDIWQVSPGDLLINNNHVITIIGVVRDDYNRVTHLETVEAQPPRAYFFRYPINYVINTLLNPTHQNGGYSLYTYIGESYCGYESCQYVSGYLDETVDMTVPDIMCEYGDKAVIPAGTDVAINVINSSGYSSIKVYKDDALIDTKSTVEDFTLEDVSYGKYKVELVGTSSSSSEFIAVDLQCAYDTSTHVVTFDSENSVPVCVNSYGSDGHQAGVHMLTESEKTAGSFDATSLVSQDDPYIRVAFQVKGWGQTAWRSHDLEMWEEV